LFVIDHTVAIAARENMSAPTSSTSSPSLSTWLSQHRRLVVAVAAAITVSTAGALYYSHAAQQARQAEQKQQKQAKKDAKKGKKSSPPATSTTAEKPKSSSSESDGESHPSLQGAALD
jgi:sRNA-binding protein